MTNNNQFTVIELKYNFKNKHITSINNILVVPCLRNHNWIYKLSPDNSELLGVYFNKIEIVMIFQLCFENIWFCMKYIAINEFVRIFIACYCSMVCTGHGKSWNMTWVMKGMANRVKSWTIVKYSVRSLKIHGMSLNPNFWLPDYIKIIAFILQYVLCNIA